MKALEIMDFIQKKINSILFRFVLIAFAVVLCVFHSNKFDNYLYVILIITYFILFLFLTNYSKLRLFNDFVFMNLILLGKNPNDIMVFTFVMLPIINSINHSGTQKSFILYLLTVLTFIVQLCNFNNKIETKFVLTNLYPLISLFFLWIINLYTDLRIKIKKFRDELIVVVEDFYLKKEEIKKPHKIYNQLINVIDKNTKRIKIKDIICFTIYKNEKDKEKLVLTNGSSFIWQFKFNNKQIVEDIRKKKYLMNVELNIDGNNKPHNLLLYSKVEEQEYIYTFITEQNLPIYYLAIGFFNRTLTPAFKKISNVLLSEKKLQEIQNEEITKLSEKSQYVNRANKTMHYIRNRLGPFSNLIKMLEELDSIPEEKITSLKSLISKETEMARIELTNITNRANDMLEKNNNPFVYTKLNQVSIERVFTTLKRNFYSFFPNFEIEINLLINLFENKKMVLLNDEGFELFLTDWLNNMFKYKKSIGSCSFTVTESNIEIVFSNDYSSSKLEIDKLISDLMSDDRNEIMRRTTHGLYIIKLTLEDMNIPFESYHDDIDNKLIMKLRIKTYDYENSSL